MPTFNPLLPPQVVVGLMFAILLGMAPQAAVAQEPAGLAAAVAIEKAMVSAIAGAEKSVVSIARIDPDQNIAVRDLSGDVFGPFGAAPLSNDDPTDPNFIPHEFATGVIVDRSGLILTNYHVLAKDSRYFIRTVDRKTFEAKVLAADVDSDLAVLKVGEEGQGSEFAPIKFGDASKLRKGQIVIALGNPYAIARDGQASASWGIVSNLSRKPGEKQSNDNALYRLGTLIQTDVKLNLGASGGALLNLQGEMIGLTTSLAALSGYEQAGGYAIPVDESFRRILEVLKAGRKVDYGYLGVRPGNLAHREVLSGAQGSKVMAVSAGTPARLGGLNAGDVVTHIDGTPIYDSDGLRLKVGQLAPGATATFTIQRAGHTVARQIMVSKRPQHMDGEKIFTVVDPDWRGLRVDYATAVIRAEALSDDNAMLAVAEVAKDSPAERAGLRPGQAILDVAGVAVQTPEQFSREVGRFADRPVTIHIVAARHPQAVTIEVP